MNIFEESCMNIFEESCMNMTTGKRFIFVLNSVSFSINSATYWQEKNTQNCRTI